MKFGQVIKNRKSIRRFLAKEVEEEKLQKILEIANRAPSAGNLQAYKIYLLKDKNIQEELTKVAGGQGSIAQASVSLVFCAAPTISLARYGARGETLYAVQDATIACCFAWLAAVDQGLSAVWIGPFDEEKVKEILNIEKDLRPVAILPIGYSAETPPETPRKNLSDLIYKIQTG